MKNHLSSEACTEISKALNTYLANSTLVYYKAHGFHWNVEGSNFYSLHLMFEKFYQELWESLDDTAERVRALGHHVPGNLADLLKCATIKETTSIPSDHEMVKILRENFMELSKNAHMVEDIADKHKDTITTDMMTEQAAFLEKSAWMLKSTLTD